MTIVQLIIIPLTGIKYLRDFRHAQKKFREKLARQLSSYKQKLQAQGNEMDNMNV